MTWTRIQRVFWGHVDVAVVDVAQHGLEGLLAGNHLPYGDVHLPIHRHEGAEHGLKVTEDTKAQGGAWGRWELVDLAYRHCAAHCFMYLFNYILMIFYIDFVYSFYLISYLNYIYELIYTLIALLWLPYHFALCNNYNLLSCIVYHW